MSRVELRFGNHPKEKCPCANCNGRYEACALDCEKWKKWKSKQEQVRAINNAKKERGDW